jgi:hypothetical protein
MRLPGGTGVGVREGRRHEESLDDSEKKGVDMKK